MMPTQAEGGRDVIMDEMELYERLGHQYIQKLWRSIYYRVHGDSDLAKDIMQDTLVKVIESIRQLRDDEKLERWISTIATNMCYEHLKKRAKHNFRNKGIDNDASFDFLSSNASPSAEDIAMLRFDIEERQAFVESQSNDVRQIIMMHGVDDLTFDEIGKILGMSPQTVKTKYYRAIKKFKARKAGVES